MCKQRSRAPLPLLMLVALLATGRAGAQEASGFPLRPAPGVDAATGRLRGSEADWTALGARRSLSLATVPLPDGSEVDLDLSRLDLRRPRFGVSVNGEPAPGLVDATELTLWRGRVSGDPASSVLLAFSPWGSRGWVRRGGRTMHLVAEPDPLEGWARSASRWIAGADLVRAGVQPDLACDTPAPADPGVRPTAPGEEDASDGLLLPLDCPVAVEGDFQLFQAFGDVTAELTYVATLLAAASDLYEQEVDVVLTYPYLNLWTVPNDPWTAQDGPDPTTEAVLAQFKLFWFGIPKGGAAIAHMLSGADLGGGLAGVDALCQFFAGFAVSGNLNGDNPFPVAQGPLTWDFVVFAHEVGHNFGALHTHDYCPPIDECAPAAYWGSCQDEQTCLTSGTIMSYCHLCPGGMANIAPTFHPDVAAAMKAKAILSCLQPYCSGLGTVFVDAAHPSGGSGTIFDPFQQLSSGLAAANPCGAQVLIQGGSYHEAPLVIRQTVTLESWGGTVLILP